MDPGIKYREAVSRSGHLVRGRYLQSLRGISGSGERDK